MFERDEEMRLEYEDYLAVQASKILKAQEREATNKRKAEEIENKSQHKAQEIEASNKVELEEAPPPALPPTPHSPVGASSDGAKRRVVVASPKVQRSD